MNSLRIIIASLILINIYLHVFSCPECLDNSHHLECYCDEKEYEPVECNCACWKYKIFPDRNQCSRCLHFHDEEPVKPKFNYSSANIVKETIIPTELAENTEKATITIRNKRSY